jgi:hypothetical protein
MGNISHRAEMKHAATSPRPPRRPKDAYMSYREASPPPRRDSPIPFASHRDRTHHTVSPIETDEFVPVQPSPYTGPQTVGDSQQHDSCALTCRDCVFFWGLQCLLIGLIAAICYLTIHLYQL